MKSPKVILKALLLVLVLGVAVAWAKPFSATESKTAQKTIPMTDINTEKGDFYKFKLKTLDGKEVDFSQYKGKKVLLVNTASECGYTKQYADLQKLHETHGDKVVVLGFPANNFGGQEPGTNEDIASFCQKNFGVTFPLFEKISVVGDDQAPIYAWLEQNAPNRDKPSWNFCKYLVNEQGQVEAFYPSKANPMGEELLAAIK